VHFRPKHFLKAPTPTTEPDPRTWQFSYVQRADLGCYIADHALFVTIAQALNLFNISQGVESDRVLAPPLRLSPGDMSLLKPALACATPRSRKHVELIKSVEVEYPWGESETEAGVS
jgi:hypothetical protein